MQEAKKQRSNKTVENLYALFQCRPLAMTPYPRFYPFLRRVHFKNQLCMKRNGNCPCGLCRIKWNIHAIRVGQTDRQCSDVPVSWLCRVTCRFSLARPLQGLHGPWANDRPTDRQSSSLRYPQPGHVLQRRNANKSMNMSTERTEHAAVFTLGIR